MLLFHPKAKNMESTNLEKPLQILLVEDSPSDAALLQENILSTGVGDISIRVTSSLREAIEHCKNNHTDAVLLDLTLPDSSGLDTVRQARQISPDLPVVVLTGVDDEKTGTEAVRMGAQDYLVKGRADGQTIIRSIRYSIERKHTEEALRQARDELEIQVQNRTAQLSQTVETLRDEVKYRRLAEKTIKQQSMFLKAYFEHALTPVVFLDPQFNFIHVNEAYARACGKRVEDFTGHNHFEFYPHAENQAIFENVVRTKTPHVATAKPFTFPDHPEWGVTYWDWALVPILNKKGKVVLLIFSLEDVTKRKLAEIRTRITNVLLELFAQKTSRKEYLDSVVKAIRQWSDCRCVGIRLANDDGFIPYESCVGFSKKFLELENMLSLKKDACVCIRVITEAPEPHKLPVKTPRGSFRCDNTFDFLSKLTETEKSQYRGNCVKHGFTSLAIVPIRYRDKILGAIHIADEKEGKVPQETVEFLESIAMLVGEAVHRFNTEAELRESEERYRHLVEMSPDGIGVERDDKIVFINTAGARMLGYTRTEELIGRPIFDFVHPDFIKRTHRQLRYLRRKKKALPAREEKFMCVDGTTLDVEVAATPLVYQNRPVTQIVFRDITERKLAQERMLADQKQLRSLTAELVLVEERERHEIAMALHDSLGPILAFTKRELKSLQKFSPAKIASSLENISDNISQAVNQTRNLTFDLSPPALYALGFEIAVEELTEQFCRDHKLEYSFRNSDEPKPLAEHVKILLYRSIREMLINIAKHAKATLVKVIISRDNENVCVTIEDDGRGFDASALNSRSTRPKGLGLFSVRERLTHIGGKLEIESNRGKGTRAILLAPLKLE